MLESLIEPIRTDSLKEVFVLRFEELILSGKIKIGQKLPSERELALQLGVSRPVVHEGLVELASRGMVSLKPRFGATVNDYRKEGSITLLASLIGYQKGKLEPELLESLLQMRQLLEPAFARFAAQNRTQDHLRESTPSSKKKMLLITGIRKRSRISILNFTCSRPLRRATRFTRSS